MPHKEALRNTIHTVEMAQSEMEIAVTCREAWLPAAYDRELHSRLHYSYAGQTFITIRQTLHREFLLALCRIWDTNKQAIRMTKIWENLRQPDFWQEVVTHRANKFATNDFTLLAENLEGKRDQVLGLIAKYQVGGCCESVLQKLKTQRNENLAHRKVQHFSHLNAEPIPSIPSDDGLLMLYTDTKLLVQVLLDLFKATYYDFDGVSKVFEHHAKIFWNGVRSEKVQGHPNFTS